ncbi:MAG: hypothetical protein WA869_05050 [Alloacidobacterium sp.]
MREAPQEQLRQRLADAGVRLTHGISFGPLDPHDDTTVRWETHGSYKNHQILHVLSYDTVTDCARRGIVLSEPSDGMLWIDAREARSKIKTPMGSG